MFRSLRSLTSAWAIGLTIGLGACAAQPAMRADGPAYVPTRGSAQGVVDPNSLPGTQRVPVGASTAGSNLGRQ